MGNNFIVACALAFSGFSLAAQPAEEFSRLLRRSDSHSCLFVSDATLVLSTDGGIRQFDVGTHRVYGNIHFAPAAATHLEPLDLGNSKKRLLAISAATELVQIDLKTGKAALVAKFHDKVLRIAAHPLGSCVFVGMEDGSVRQTDIETGKVRRILVPKREGATPIMSDLQISRDGKFVAVCFQRNYPMKSEPIQVWNCASYELAALYQTEHAYKRTVAFDPRNSARLFVGNEGSQLCSWNFTERLETLGLVAELPAAPRLLRSSPNGKVVVAHCINGYLMAIDVANGKTIAKTRPNVLLTDICVSPNGELIAFCGEGRVGVWEYKTGKFLGVEN